MVYRLAKTAPDSMIVLPTEVLDKLDNAGLTETRILLHLARMLLRGAWTEEMLLESLEKQFRREEVKSALAFWRGVGILDVTGDPEQAPSRRRREQKEEPAATTAPVDADEPPFYSGQDLAAAKEKNPHFKNLVDFMEKRLNKVLNAGELAKVWSFLDFMGMPADVVMLITEDCCARGHGNLRYITKAVMSFQDQGLDSYEKAEAYYLRQAQGEKFARKIRTLFGLGDRALTKTEDAHLTEWMQWAFSDEMLTLAYEKTVAAAAKPSINYMHKILQNWKEAGLATPAQVEQAGVQKKQDNQGKGPKSYDLDTFFEAAVAKQRKDLK